MNTSADERLRALVSLQQALLGEVTPHLRAVVVNLDVGVIDFVCYFDGELCDNDFQSMSEVETKVISDFAETHRISHQVVRLDFPAPVPKNGDWVYLRKEESS